MQKSTILLLFGLYQVILIHDVTGSPVLEAQSSVIQVEDFVCPGNGFFAIPGACSGNYYACVDGVPYVQSCPGNTIFDPVALQCTSPEIVSCTNSTTTTTSGPFTCPYDGNFAIPDQCTSYYYICVGDTAYLATCPGGNIFDPLLLQCASPASASCSNTTTTPATTTSGPFVCPNDGNFPVPGECSSNYYICVAGVPYPVECPGNNIFDPLTLQCTTPESASCTTTTLAPTTTTTPTTTPTTTTTSGPFTCPQANGNFPIPGACSSDYFICVGSVPYPSTCPGGGIFDPELLACVNPGSASCQSSPTTQGPSGFQCPTPDGEFANPNDCSTYYVCTNNRPILQNCATGTVFNPVTGQCDFPSNVPGCEEKADQHKTFFFSRLQYFYKQVFH